MSISSVRLNSVAVLLPPKVTVHSSQLQYLIASRSNFKNETLKDSNPNRTVASGFITFRPEGSDLALDM